MARKLTISIPLIIGSNGKWCTMGDDPDWGLMADSIMDGDKDPKQSRKYVVRVTVEVPPDEEVIPADGIEEAV